jgi:hypothetical protein
MYEGLIQHSGNLENASFFPKGNGYCERGEESSMDGSFRSA